MKDPIRIANFSGAAGDYFEALHDAVHGDPVNVLVGDYLAEIAFGIVLQRSVEEGDPALVQKEFSFDIFMQQVVPELKAIADKGLKLVTNAGAFNPLGMAQRLREAIVEARLDLKVATVTGDDLLPRVQELAGEGQLASMDSGLPLGNLSGRIIAANAYLGGWGIAAALEAGADIVITGRVTDASLTMGPAAWWHGWSKSDFNAVAGGIAAGHIIECGPQASGGNFSGFKELGDVLRLGFPIAEIEADGSFVVTKQSAAKGFVSPDTVTAQLLYEIQGPRYLNSDAVLHIDSLAIAQDGQDRVRVSAIKGSKPPATTKVGCFYLDGWRLVMIVYITGLDWREKVDWIHQQMSSIASGLELDEFYYQPLGQPIEQPASQAEATMVVRIAAAAQERDELERLIGGFTSLGLGSVPGYTGEFGHLLSPRMEFWPGIADQGECEHCVTLDDGRSVVIELPENDREAATSGTPLEPSSHDSARFGKARAAPLGEIIHARSGDKGGDASLGIWCKSPEAFDWVVSYLTGEQVHTLMGLAENVRVDAFPLPNISGVLFVLRGQFGRSGTSNIMLDQIGKGLGEFLRACVVEIPESLIEKASKAASQA
ncbi:MAG: DUF1446 domain-containing protein [Novosphingobium sp.]|nr:DUF1446 domain-containing protein [Novosphingobium sp.]